MSTSIVAHENQILVLNTMMGCKRVSRVWKIPLHLKRQQPEPLNVMKAGGLAP